MYCIDIYIYILYIYIQYIHCKHDNYKHTYINYIWKYNLLKHNCRQHIYYFKHNNYKSDYWSCLYPSLNKYVLRCFLNDKNVVINLIAAGKQFHSLGAAVTKARSPAAVLERGCLSIIDRSSRRKVCCSTSSHYVGGSFAVNCQEY